MTDGTFVSPFPVEDPEGLAATEAAQGELARTVGRLVDAVVRTRVDDATLTDVTAAAQELTARLLEVAQEGPLGAETCSDGRLRDHGNPMAGMRNPIAPPLSVVRDDTGDEGGVTTTFSLGAAYEGPPGCVHGGIIAAILDQVAGTVPAILGRPGLTAYLNTTYRRPTVLGKEHTCRAWVDRADGYKTFVRGEIRDARDRVTAEVEALFVVPSWVRERLEDPAGAADLLKVTGEAWEGHRS